MMNRSYRDISFIREEHCKVFPNSVKSVFEEEVLHDVYKWFLSLPAGSTLTVGKEVIDAYWKTKLS